jgi:hypothetical protein
MWQVLYSCFCHTEGWTLCMAAMKEGEQRVIVWVAGGACKADSMIAHRPLMR